MAMWSCDIVSLTRVPRVLGTRYKAVSQGNVRLPSPQTGSSSSTTGLLEGFLADIRMTTGLM